MKTQFVSRRQVLRGAGGFTLGLPFLPSLVPARAWCQERTFRGPKRFVAIMTDHGGVRPANFFPPDRPDDQRREIFPGHEVRFRPLASERDGGDAVLSPVLRAPASLLTPRILARMNVLYGFAIPFGIAHHTGGHLGNYARNDGNGDEGRLMQAYPWPTIDNVMAWAPGFYRDPARVRRRVIVTGDRRGYSWDHANPAARSGPIQDQALESDARRLFDAVIGDQSPPSGPVAPPRPPVVDRVLESYRRLRDGNRRLSADDRVRLEAHIARLAELEARLRAPARTVTCGEYPAATGQGQAREFGERNSVIALAFACGASQVATISATQPFVAYSGSWHQDVAHQWDRPEAQARLVESNRNVFAQVFADLVNKLDIEEGPGESVLDNTLVQWTMESGFHTHQTSGLPVITAGSAGGFLRTGLHVDYRRRVAAAAEWGKPLEYDYLGLTYGRWLATVLRAMGVPAAFYRREGHPGYGQHFIGEGSRGRFVPGVVETADDPVPLITA